jgi:type I restriction enzyme M protein
MSTSSAQIVQKLWSYCNVLRDDGLSYGDYVEQLTFLLFLKMAHERTQAPWNQKSFIPEGYEWTALLTKDGEPLERQYRRTLEAMGRQDGMLGLIFRKAQNKIQDPAKLRRLVADLIDRENWTMLGADVKGDAYEGLLEKNAQDTKGGAGQYFTPRSLIDAIVEVMQPGLDDTICDPACGTGGFLLSAHDYVVDKYRSRTKEQNKHLKYNFVHGCELVPSVTRLCAMNLMLHGLGPTTDEAPAPVETTDSLAVDPGVRYSMILSNPPFGKKSSMMFVTEDGDEAHEALTITRDDFWATTSNKQLNFVQHVKTLLQINGRAAMVLPDNVLFEGGAGETIRRKLMHECDLHTLLRLPTGIFYAQGVKANVLFFERKPASEKAWTSKLWVYDLRTNQHFTLKTNPLKEGDLKDFIDCYSPGQRSARKATWSESNPTGRWRPYTYKEILARDKCSLDILWLKDETLESTQNLPPPHEIARDIAEDLRAALEQFEGVAADLAP